MTDMTARAMALANSRKTGDWCYNTDIALRKWRSKLARIRSGQNGIVNLHFAGDSITEGTGCSNHYTKSYYSLVRDYFNSVFPDCGFGFYPPFYCWGDPLFQLTGTWLDDNYYGVCTYARKTSVVDDTASLTFTGVGFDLWYVQAGGGAKFTISIDGGAEQETDSNGSPTYSKITVNGLANASHTLRIRCSGVGTLRLVGITPITQATRGVRCHMMSKFGSILNHHIQPAAQQAAFDMIAPNLTIIALMANDFNGQTALSTYRNSLQTIISKALGKGSEVLLVTTGIRKNNSKPILQAEYNNINKELAFKNNIGFIDIFNRWGEDFDYCKNTLEFIADDVHPNDNGHQDLATAIINVIK